MSARAEVSTKRGSSSGLSLRLANPGSHVVAETISSLIEPLQKFRRYDAAGIAEMSSPRSHLGDRVQVAILSISRRNRVFVFRRAVTVTVQLHIDTILCDFRHLSC